MRDRSLIYLGLLVFLASVSIPFTYNLIAGSGAMPELQLPANETQCVESKDYMRNSHMQLLIDWRETQVRENKREYTSSDGRVFEIGLTDTCLMQCHTSKENFCDRCHTYTGVQGPYCWDCHIDPENIQWSGQ
ncbi:MAG: sulfate reduction electron transfer complex DsrMKJOP subunit DsrJ [Acidobacteriota bacterium]